MSKIVRVLEAFKAGEEMTAKQIASRFKVSNPHDAVRQLRMKGYAVYANARTNSKGETKSFYRLGTPTRAMVATYYASNNAV